MLTKFNTIDIDARFPKKTYTRIDNEKEILKCKIPGCNRVFPKINAHTMPEKGAWGKVVLVPCCQQHFNILLELKK